MTTTETGRRAETAAAAFLVHKGCQIIARNWRTRLCEIDIVAERAGVMYFVEVKYRIRNTQGAGLEYITAAKLRRMRFAAESWVHAHRYQGSYRLSAVEVSGEQFVVTAAISDLEL